MKTLPFLLLLLGCQADGLGTDSGTTRGTHSGSTSPRQSGSASSSVTKEASSCGEPFLGTIDEIWFGSAGIVTYTFCVEEGQVSGWLQHSNVDLTTGQITCSLGWSLEEVTLLEEGPIIGYTTEMATEVSIEAYLEGPVTLLGDCGPGPELGTKRFAFGPGLYEDVEGWGWIPIENGWGYHGPTITEWSDGSWELFFLQAW